MMMTMEIINYYYDDGNYIIITTAVMMRRLKKKKLIIIINEEEKKKKNECPYKVFECWCFLDYVVSHAMIFLNSTRPAMDVR